MRDGALRTAETPWLMMNQMHLNPEQITGVGSEWAAQRVLAAGRGVSQRSSAGESDSTASTATP